MEPTIEAETKQLSRMELEAVAQAAVREGLSAEQVAYEQWVDTQPIEEVVAWDDMGEEERREWVEKNMGREVVDLVDGRGSVEQGVVVSVGATAEHGELPLTPSGMWLF
jgi:hypothetical protein